MNGRISISISGVTGVLTTTLTHNCTHASCLQHTSSCTGELKRLVYGLDSHGLLCGANNTYKDTVMDLTDKPNLYYLDALELLDPANIMYARTVCVSSCPSVEEQCGLSSLPCTNNTQYRCVVGRWGCALGRLCVCPGQACSQHVFKMSVQLQLTTNTLCVVSPRTSKHTCTSTRCPYYRTADQGLWTRLPSVDSPSDVDYWSDLASVTLDSASCSDSFLQVGLD